MYFVVIIRYCLFYSMFKLISLIFISAFNREIFVNRLMITLINPVND